jgi:hypothetical protein
MFHTVAAPGAQKVHMDGPRAPSRHGRGAASAGRGVTMNATNTVISDAELSMYQSNMWTNFAFFGILYPLVQNYDLTSFECFLTISTIVNSFAFHGLDAQRAGGDYVRYEMFHRADLATAQFQFVQAAMTWADHTVMTLTTRYTIMASWALVHLFLHIGDFYAILSAYVASILFVMQMLATIFGYLPSRVPICRRLFLALLFVVAALIFYFYDTTNKTYLQYHGPWHVAMSIAGFIYYTLQQPALQRERSARVAAVIEQDGRSLVERLRETLSKNDRTKTSYA